MGDTEIITLIEAFGDDAKTAFVAYLVCDYGVALLVVGLCTWGIRTV